MRGMRLILILAGVAAAALGSANEPPIISADAPEPPALDDPFPIRRIRVSEEQLADARKQLDPGPLVRMPRADFEARVRSASLAATHAVPRLAEAAYSATLSGDDLTGEARWDLHNPGDRAAAFPLEPFRLAVREAAWADGQPAILGTLGSGFPTSPAVWVERGGRHTLHLKWSAAGLVAGGERRFELRVPPCPIATLDLTLPEDHVPTLLGTEAILSGPLPVPKSGKLLRQRTWRLRFGSRTTLMFAVRGPGNAADTNPMRGSLVAKYDLAPRHATCAFEYDLLPTRGAVREWVFTVDPGLRIIDAVTFSRAGPAQFEPGSRPELPGTLRVPLRQPGTGGKVLITALATTTAGALPMVRPAGTTLGEERIEIRVHPELRLAGWSPGDYRLVENLAGADQSRTLTWVGSLLPANREASFRRPPEVHTTDSTAEFTTREAVEWRVENGEFVLAIRLNVRVKRGPLFGLTLRTPTGYEPRRTASGTDDLIAFLGSTPAGPHGLLIEFARPLTAGQQIDLRFDLRGPALATMGTRPTRLPLPRFEPVGASEREGWIALGPVPGWNAAVDLTSGPLPPADTARSDPPVPRDTVATFAFRGREPEGWIALNPVRAEFTAESTVRIRSEGPRWRITTRFDLLIGTGAMPAATVFVPGVVERSRTWTLADDSNAILSATPIPLGAFDGTSALLAAPLNLPGALVQAQAHGEGPWLRGTYWILRFVRPLTGRARLESTEVVPLPELQNDPITLRRLILCGIPLHEPRVEFDPPRHALTRMEPDAINVVRGVAAIPTSSPGHCTFAGLYLIGTVGTDRADAVFGGTVSGPAGATAPLTLPDGAELLSVAVGGHWLGPGVAVDAAIRIPIPSTGPATFEVRYRLPNRGDMGLRRVSLLAPELPGGPHPIARRWAVRADALPCDPELFIRRGDENPRPDPEGMPWPADAVPIATSSEALVVIPSRVAQAVGLALAALLAALAWVGVRRCPGALGTLAFVIGMGAGLALLHGPPGWDMVSLPPFVVALVVLAAAIGVRGMSRPRTPALIAAALAVGMAVQAQPRAADTVLLVGPEEITFVPQALLDRLDAAAKPPVPTTTIVSAAYEGRVEETTARITARFSIVSFARDDAVVTLPLADVRLESATVDEHPAFPIAVRPDLYAFTVSGRGRHTIEVRFAVPVAAIGPERDLRFGIPEVPSAKLGLTIRGSAEQLQVGARIGAQTVAKADASARIDAELGNLRTVQVRWRQAVSGSPDATYREACVWDVSEAEAELNACYLIKIDRGSIGQFRIDVPAELEPTRVAVRAADLSASAPPVLRDWTVGPAKDGFRPLILNLAGPSDGRLVLTLECVPRHAPTRQPVLRFPRLNTPAVKPVPNGIYYVFRTNAITVEDRTPTGTIDLPPDDLLFHFGGVANLKLDAADRNLKVFRPVTPTTRAEYRPQLRPGPMPPTLSAETTWRIGPSRAEADGLMRWQGPDVVAAVEFDLPEVRMFGARLPLVVVNELRGVDVGGWAQRGGRVQIWFRKPTREAIVEWLGRAVFAMPVPATGGPSVLPAVTPQPVNGKLATQTVRIRADADSTIRVTPPSVWKPAAASPGREWAFTSDQLAAPVRVDLFPPGILGPARGFGLIDASGDTLVYRAAVEVPLRAGRPHRLVLSATGLPPQSTAELDLPPGVVAVEQQSLASSRAWILESPPTAGSALRVTVIIRLPRPADAVRLPAIAAGAAEAGTDPDGAVRWIGVTGIRRGLTLLGASPAGLAEVRTAWPGEAERLRVAGGTLWAVPTGSAPPRLAFDRPVPTSLAPPPRSVNDAPHPTPSEEPASGTVSSRLDWMALAGLALAGLVFGLFLILPRTTWPEQLALLGLLVGIAMGIGWWLGIVAEAVARGLWLARRLRFIA